MNYLLNKSRVQGLISTLIRNKKLFNKVDESLSLLNIGCGKNIYPGFVNIDFNWNPDINICQDITIGLQVASDRFDGVFTEHCLEHVTYNQCVKVIEEIHRVLKPGGVARIVVPDGGLYIKLYNRFISGEIVEFPYVDDQGEKDLIEDSRYGFTPMMAVNRIFRGYGHVFAYDYDTLKNLLINAGFRDIKPCGFRQGMKEELLIDSILRESQSLFIEGVK